MIIAAMFVTDAVALIDDDEIEKLWRYFLVLDEGYRSFGPTLDSAGLVSSCPSSAAVMGLDPHGDGFLSILSGPGGSFREVSRLKNDENVGSKGWLR